MPTILITGPTVEPVTVAEVKANCRFELSSEDAAIAKYISSAREMAEQITGRSLASQTWERVLDSFPSGEIELLNPPIVSISSIKYIDTAGVQQTLSESLYTLDADSTPGWVLPSYGTSWPATLDSANAVRVRYTAGYANGACPAAIQDWIIAMASARFRHREAMTDKPLQSLPFLDGLLDRYRVY